MRWDLRLAGTGVDGQSSSVEALEFIRSDGLGDIAKPGLTLAEGNQLLAQLRQGPSPRRPTTTRCCGRTAVPGRYGEDGEHTGCHCSAR